MPSDELETLLPDLKRQKLLRDQVYDILRKQILTGAFPQGYKLIEDRLALHLNVSRTPVREAIQRLIVNGLVQPNPTCPAEVVGVTRENMEQCFDVREVLEMFASRLAASRSSEALVERLRDLHAEESRALESGNIGQLKELNTAFHNEILNATGNDILKQLVNNLLMRVPSYEMFVMDLDTRREFWRSHQRIIEALEKGDAELAEREMSAHIELAKQALLDEWARPGD
jgi:DNA-binding GntR family transcriptional regulator